VWGLELLCSVCGSRHLQRGRARNAGGRGVGVRQLREGGKELRGGQAAFDGLSIMIDRGRGVRFDNRAHG
jgi:hypothetical protein